MKKLNYERIEEVVSLVENEFTLAFPSANHERHKDNLGKLITILGLLQAPVGSLEFIEALRSFANALEILVNESKE